MRSNLSSIIGVVAPFVAFLLLQAGCVPEPSINTGPDANIIAGNLYEVENPRVDVAYIDPSVDFAN